MMKIKTDEERESKNLCYQHDLIMIRYTKRSIYISKVSVYPIYNHWNEHIDTIKFTPCTLFICLSKLYMY